MRMTYRCRSCGSNATADLRCEYCGAGTRPRKPHRREKPDPILTQYTELAEHIAVYTGLVTGVVLGLLALIVEVSA